MPSNCKQRKIPRSTVLFFALGFLALASCGRKAPGEYAPSYGSQSQSGATTPEYVFGFFPGYGAVELSQMYQPVMDAINRQAQGFTVRMESSVDFPAFEAKLRQGKLDFALTNAYEAVTAEKAGYTIFGKAKGDESNYGIIIVRKDSGIRTVHDLRGKTISFPSPTAFIASMATKTVLMKAGLNPDKDAKPVYVGSLDSVVMNVYSGLSAAGGSYPGNWEATKEQHPEISSALEVKWRSAPLPNGGLVARSGIPEAHIQAIANTLFGLDTTAEGRAIIAHLHYPGFERASSKSYEPISNFLAEYKRLFGSLPMTEGSHK